jgi:hypothetical protein
MPSLGGYGYGEVEAVNVLTGRSHCQSAVNMRWSPVSIPGNWAKSATPVGLFRRDAPSRLLGEAGHNGRGTDVDECWPDQDAEVMADAVATRDGQWGRSADVRAISGRLHRDPVAKTPPLRSGGASPNSLSHNIGAPGFGAEGERGRAAAAAPPGTSGSRSAPRRSPISSPERTPETVCPSLPRSVRSVSPGTDVPSSSNVKRHS